MDYTKAFDSVEHIYVWKALLDQGVQHKYIRLLAELYNDSQAKIRTERTGENFRLERGVNQGDPPITKTLHKSIRTPIHKLKWGNDCGININGTNLTHLQFADDIVVIAKSASEEQMLTELDRVSKEAGLKMNPTKTQIMTNTRLEPINITDTPLEYVSEYTNCTWDKTYPFTCPMRRKSKGE